MNILKANFTGSVGATTGAVVKGKNIIKSKIWSKRPANVAQTGAVRSFEAVNRLAGAIAKSAWELTGLSAKNILKHNAVARYLSPMLKNKVFEPQNISDLLPTSTRYFVRPIDTNPSSMAFTYQIGLFSGKLADPNEKIIFLVFNEIGVVHFINTFDAVPQTITVPLIAIDRQNLQFLAIISSGETKKFLSSVLPINQLLPPITFNINPYLKLRATQPTHAIALAYNLQENDYIYKDTNDSIVFKVKCNITINFPATAIGENIWIDDNYTLRIMRQAGGTTTLFTHATAMNTGQTVTIPATQRTTSIEIGDTLEMVLPDSQWTTPQITILSSSQSTLVITPT